MCRVVHTIFTSMFNLKREWLTSELRTHCRDYNAHGKKAGAEMAGESFLIKARVERRVGLRWFLSPRKHATVLIHFCKFLASGVLYYRENLSKMWPQSTHSSHFDIEMAK